MQKKSGRGPALGELPKLLEFPLIFLQQLRLASSDFKCGMLLGFAKGHHKITSRGKSRRGPGLVKLRKILGSPLIFLQRLKIATSKLAGWWGFPRTIIKSHPDEKEGVALG